MYMALFNCLNWIVCGLWIRRKMAQLLNKLAKETNILQSPKHRKTYINIQGVQEK